MEQQNNIQTNCNLTPSIDINNHKNQPTEDGIIVKFDELNLSQNNGAKKLQKSYAAPLDQLINQFKMENYTIKNLQQLKSFIFSDDVNQIHHGAIGISRIIGCQNPSNYIDKIIQIGILPRIFQIATQNDYLQLKRKGIHILSNIASGSCLQLTQILKMGVTNVFQKGLENNDLDIIQSSIYGIGNISCDDPKQRDIVVDMGIIQKLIDLIQNPIDQKTQNLTVWAISNIVRVKPVSSKIKQAPLIIKNFCKILKTLNEKDQSIILDILWTLSYIIDQRSQAIDLLMSLGVTSTIINFIFADKTMNIVSLRLIGNICWHNNFSYIEILIKQGLLTGLQKMLKHHKKLFRRQACWIISNITADYKGVQIIFKNQKLLSLMCEVLHAESSNDVKVQLCYALLNPINNQPYMQKYATFEFYNSLDMVKILLQLVNNQDKSVRTVLQLLYSILVAGKRYCGGGIWVQKNRFIESKGQQILSNVYSHYINTLPKNLSIFSSIQKIVNLLKQNNIGF